MDELAFWRADEESANPDKAVLAAIRPSMATFGDAGLLVAASSPYDKHGVLWEAYRKFFGIDDGASPKTYRYFGFIDPSGGQQDAFALAVAHAEGKTLVLDCLREIVPPLSPQSAVSD